ncbi:MAG: glycosyltransferase, partial [Cyanobacteriota bacterium]|nr:glycosyltransferase [Cyanobacteriota bacterium]
SVGEGAPKIAEAIATNEATKQAGQGRIKQPSLLEKIKAQLERSQTEMQQVRADLEGSKTGKKQDPEKKTEKLATDYVTDVTDGLSQGKQASPPPSPPLSRGAGGDPLPLLGLSGVTVDKFWSLVDPVIGKQRPTSNPAISILTPTWNSSLDWFVETVLSVLHQTNPDWEWCLVDDGSKNQDIKTVLAGLAEKEPRIKVRFAESGGISAATNKALSMATGDYICCLDHDDTLTPTALEDSLEVLTGGTSVVTGGTSVVTGGTPVLREGFDVSYSDEDKIDLSGLNYIQPFFKPDWSPEYFRGVMYVGHLLCVRRELALQVGGFKSEFDGVQDYEFMLRVSELTDKIAHIPKHLYHWRQVRGSISADADAKAGIETVQQAAVNAHLQRLGLPAKAEPGLGRHRVNINPHPRSENPLVSLIVSSLNPDDRLGPWLNQLLSKTVYPNLEVIVVLTYEKTEQLPETIHNSRVKTISFPNNSSATSAFNTAANFSRANNFAAKEATGEYLVFLKPGVIPHADTPDWLRHFLYYGEQNDVGAVGGLLLFGDNITVEHAGIVVGEIPEAIATNEIGEIAEAIATNEIKNCHFVMRDVKAGADGYAGSLVCAREVSAVSKDCLMVKKSEFEELGGFNEHLLTGYQEVDLCLRMRRENKRIIFTPRSVLLNPHSTNLELENADFLDKMLLLDSHQIEIDKGDPYHNPNLVIEVA